MHSVREEANTNKKQIKRQWVATERLSETEVLLRGQEENKDGEGIE